MDVAQGAGEPARRFVRPPQRFYPPGTAPVSLDPRPSACARQPAGTCHQNKRAFALAIIASRDFSNLNHEVLCAHA
jgi:hypothetical protein